MIISRTPFRISLFGGGTDFPQWYRKHGGAVLGFALNKYCYVSLRKLPPFFEYKHRIVYSKVETTDTIAEIEHPAVRCALTYCGVDCGVEIHHDGDLPSRSGLGSSSAFTVGLLHALYAQQGLMRSKEQLTEAAIVCEQEIMRENVGSQDQVWAAHGGLNWIEFSPDSGAISVNPIIIHHKRLKELTSNLMLVFTGFSRNASVIEGRKLANLNESALVGIATASRAALRALVDGDLDDLGRLLHTSWQLKKEMATGVSNKDIDELYNTCREAGALGGKLIGAGGGGFLLLYIKPHLQHGLQVKLHDHIMLPVGIDWGGSRIIIYDPES